MATNLLVYPEFRCTLPLPCFWRPYLNLELPCSERIPKERLRRVGAQRNARESRLSARTKIFDDSIGVVNVCSNVERVWAVHRIIVSSVEESDRPGLGRFRWQLVEEAAEAGMRRVV